MMKYLLQLLIIVSVFLFWFSGASATNSPRQNYDVYSQPVTIKKIVKRGDTASTILNTYLPLKTIFKLSEQSRQIFSLTRIRESQPYRIIIDQTIFKRFEYEIDETNQLVIEQKNQAFSIFIEPIRYDIKVAVVTATISYSLNQAVRKAGEKNELAVKLADIFAWDIDFIRDIQPGDSFKVLVEKRYKDGRQCGYGDIKAAFFVNDGTLYKAFQFTDKDGRTGYFDENGQSLQKAFLKAPLSFSRISSKFTNKRLHPILKVYRPHPGVDYAAPKGTPIKTVGDGQIIKKGYNKGMGNYITIRHFNGYTTSYNHMSRFAKGMKRNRKVVQGEVIGYVGSTGYATGPHLDFRMTKNGKLIDPLKHKAPSADPVNPDEMNAFNEQVVLLAQKISTGKTIVLLHDSATQ